MAESQYTAPATYSITFPSLSEAEVKVSVNGAELSNSDYSIAGYSTSGSGTVTITSTVNTGDIVRIFRDTDVATPEATFAPGASIKANDLNENNQQLRYKLEEKVDESNIASRAVTTDALRDLIVTTDKIAADAVTNAKLADNSVAIEQMQDNSVNTAELVNDSVTTAKILDLNVTTAKIADDSVTEPKLAANSVTNRQIADASISGEKLTDNTLDVQKIKGLDKAETSEYATTWANDDDQVATVGALAARHDVVVSTTQPTTAQPGKQWLNITPGNQEHKIYDGSGWRTVAVGQPYSPTTATIIRYVDATNGSDAADVTGFLPQQPLATIKRAIDLINSDSADGSLVLVAPGVYQETLPIQIQRKNVSIVGQALRSCFVQPTQATETNTMFECNSGTLLANMTFVGLKASGTRGNSTYDSDATYGLPENQGWCAAFFNNAVIKKSPYIQNCTSFNDSSIDNSVKYDQTNLPPGGLGGDTTSAMSGGGILCDGSVPDTTSPLRSFVVDSFTQINLDGPGILVTNSGYAQLVSFFGTFCHYHAKALNGGQINLSNCTTDFGRYGLISDGRSNAKITGSSVGTTSAAATSITVDGLTIQNNFFSNQPGSTMVMEVGGESYQVLSATAVSSNTSTINIYRATDADPNTNLGFKAQINDNSAVTFKLRSYISTGGHTFEYVGSGTDYSAHPDYGGIAVEANQVVELGGDGTSDDQIYNRGKVWQSSTDENGKFKVGDKFQVDQRLGTITLDGYTVATELLTDTTPQLGGDLDLNSQDITGTGNINITGTVTATSYNGDGSSLTGINTDLVSDTTPQLGGDLDVNGQKIVTTSNGHILLEPNGTGKTYIQNSNFAGNLQLGAGSSFHADVEYLYDNGNAKTLKLNSSGSGGNISLQCNGSERIGVDTNGNISFSSGTDDTITITSTGTGDININPGTGNVNLTSTTSLKLPVGTEAQRPGTAAKGMIRFNDDTDKFEGYDGANWGSLIGGDIGTDPENVPLNQFLGKQAFVDEVGTVIPSASDPQRNKDINFEYVSDTSIKIRMRGADGVVRSTTLTLS